MRQGTWACRRASARTTWTSIKKCEKSKVPADFYIKTFHHHNYPSGPKPEEIKGAYDEIPGTGARTRRKPSTS